MEYWVVFFQWATSDGLFSARYISIGIGTTILCGLIAWCSGLGENAGMVLIGWPFYVLFWPFFLGCILVCFIIILPLLPIILFIKWHEREKA